MSLWCHDQIPCLMFHLCSCSPVPVYALIDPYESKPLPLIIGTEGFLADDKVGLEVSSSEENSKMTFSPDDTDSEEDLEDETDRATLQQKPIPASSSRALVGYVIQLVEPLLKFRAETEIDSIF